MKRLFGCLLIVFLALSASAQDRTSNPAPATTDSPEPPLDRYADLTRLDWQHMMRSAIWYFDHYWIEKDRADALEEIVARQDALVVDWTTNFDEEHEARIKAESNLIVWKTIAIVTGIATAALLAERIIAALKNAP